MIFYHIKSDNAYNINRHYRTHFMFCLHTQLNIYLDI